MRVLTTEDEGQTHFARGRASLVFQCSFSLRLPSIFILKSVSPGWLKVIEQVVTFPKWSSFVQWE